MIRNDPVLAYNFLVTFVDSSGGGGSGSTVSAIERSALGGFSEVSGLEMSLEPIRNPVTGKPHRAQIRLPEGAELRSWSSPSPPAR